MDFTVIIPTYNGAERLPLVLEKLRSQQKIESLQGEIIVIDNNSTDNTAMVVKKYQENELFFFPLKYHVESQQGAAFSRQRGVKEAQGELIGFLDDDNLPADNWIYEAYQFAKMNPQVGAIGSKILGKFQGNVPDGFEKISQFLAIRDHGFNPHLFEPKNLRLPPSAGLVVRKQAWCQSVPSTCLLTGPKGTIPTRGEDYEVLLYIHKAGWEIWYNPSMIIEHLIPNQRLTKEYLLPLAKGIGLATCSLRMILAKDWEKPMIWLKTLLGNFKRILFHFLKYGFFIQNNLIATFELHFYWGSFLSPFYYLQQLIKLKNS